MYVRAVKVNSNLLIYCTGIENVITSTKSISVVYALRLLRTLLIVNYTVRGTKLNEKKF
jgi:hypothetical protein